MIICSQCGETLERDDRVCSECGTQVALPSVSDVRPIVPLTPPLRQPIQQAVYAQTPAPVTPVVSKSQVNPIAWIAVSVGLLVLVIITVLGFTVTTKTSDNANVTSNAGGRIAYSKFNGVHVRNAPNSNATVITDIQKNQAVRVLRESSNNETVFIQSINKAITDNWSEIQVDSMSVHGWVFSGFIR